VETPPGARGLTWSAHISWLFEELPYPERPKAARMAGFRCIETAWPQQADRENLAGTIADQGLCVSLLNCPAGNVEAGERGFINDPSRSDEAERGFSAAAALAVQIGAPKINVLIGRAIPTLSMRRQRDAVVSRLRSFAAEAQARGLLVVVEPLNEAENPGYLAPDPTSARQLIEDAGSEALGLLFDVYHLARVGVDPLGAIDRHGQLIRHVQISDFPGRGQPGTGSLNLAEILSRLRSSGYWGAIGLEYRPSGSTLSSLAFTRRPGFPVSF
jgi:hydroxypyruvate isomerase